ncbi:MAG TPA: glutathione S-transferase family protein [Solirubrobacteraceae bacterium]|jgi:glutathione S-transferase
MDTVSTHTLTLYEHPFALYCQKVLIALGELGVAYDVLEEQRDFDRAGLAEIWPPASIPVLLDGDEVIGESSIIIEHLAGARLVPSLQARKWDRICDQYVTDAVQTIVFDTIEERFDERAGARARGQLEMAYDMLEAQLDQHEFLAADTFTIADCAAGPGLFYALAIHPWDEPTHPALTRYYRTLAHRPSFAGVISGARPYRQLFPLPWPSDFDRYHAPFDDR